ncbi:hypothetical protein QF026_008489 [Streptomyces aurantiacus]|nr:hypothetical protein [Streptomyces aurantiacus]
MRSIFWGQRRSWGPACGHVRRCLPGVRRRASVRKQPCQSCPFMETAEGIRRRDRYARSASAVTSASLWSASTVCRSSPPLCHAVRVCGAYVPGAGRRDPQQSAPVVGEGDHEQTVAFILAGVVLPVFLPGSAPGTDHRSVQQYDAAAHSGDLLQGPVQAWGAGGEQADDLLDPSGHGGAVYSVAVGQAAGPLVTAQHCQHDGGDLPCGQGAPPRADLLEVAAYQVGEPVQGGSRQRQAGGADKAVRALDGTVVFLHTSSTTVGVPSVTGGAHATTDVP